MELRIQAVSMSSYNANLDSALVEYRNKMNFGGSIQEMFMGGCLCNGLCYGGARG